MSCCLFRLMLLVAIVIGHVAGSAVDMSIPHLRGVPLSKLSFYPPDRDFQCLDGSQIIPFEYVNDDYCDCADGSDEPGTAACTNGSFYCQNKGHNALLLPSSWVNDGICDCCDTSDEYASGTICTNNCEELGREARIEAQKAAQLIIEGNKIRLEMIAKAKQNKKEVQQKLLKLKTDHKEVELVCKEKEILKNQAEEREASALAKYKASLPEQPSIDTAKGDDESDPINYFKLLDSDESGTVTVIELQTRVTFDQNRDGMVSKEEALYFLNNNEEVTMQEFIDSVWSNMKPFVMLEQGLFKPSEQIEESIEKPESVGVEQREEKESDEAALSDDEEKHEEEEEEEEDHEPEPELEHHESEIEVQYDEETQALIDEATNARERFQEAEKSKTELLNEIHKLEEKLDRDYGVDDEFAVLDGSCFEYTDLEYIYTLCLYGRANQRSKSGGSDVVLGYFNEWAGPEGNKYSVAKYDRGLTCWNGPSRSTTVSLVCGRENKIISVSEPARCEYAMEFATPALCNPSVAQTDLHDEL